MAKLSDLHREIANCNRCSLFTKVSKNPALERGNIAKIMIVGIAPGRTEIVENKAFSGRGGKKLFNWLAEAGLGNSEDQIRKIIYFTSLIKCFPAEGSIDSMFAHCHSFLVDQLALVSPKILITLGIDPFNKLFDKKFELQQIVGLRFTKEELVIPSFFEDDIFTSIIYIIPLPHPSGLSRWLNDKGNLMLLEKAISLLEKTNNEI